jgi:hypothetical protein
MIPLQSTNVGLPTNSDNSVKSRWASIVGSSQLEATALSKETYHPFLEEIIRTYDNIYNKEGRTTDGKLLNILTNSDHSDKVYISLKVGECPFIPANPDRCNYFHRFSSKVSGHLTSPAKTVERKRAHDCEEVLWQQGLFLPRIE